MECSLHVTVGLFNLCYEVFLRQGAEGLCSPSYMVVFPILFQQFAVMFDAMWLGGRYASELRAFNGSGSELEKLS